MFDLYNGCVEMFLAWNGFLEFPNDMSKNQFDLCYEMATEKAGSHALQSERHFVLIALGTCAYATLMLGKIRNMYNEGGKTLVEDAMMLIKRFETNEHRLP